MKTKLIKNLFSAASVVTTSIMTSFSAMAAEPAIGSPAPQFKVKNQAGQEFDLSSRKGQWTVLYFYPKADTPGCTKQACAFRDNIDKLRAQGAEVYGISADTVEAQAAFHKKHHLKFDLLADADGRVVDLYGSKMPVMKMSKRWTFIVDPELKVQSLRKDIDPAKDAYQVAEEIARLKLAKPVSK